MKKEEKKVYCVRWEGRAHGTDIITARSAQEARKRSKPPRKSHVEGWKAGSVEEAGL